MASTIPLQRTIDFTQTFAQLRPLTGVGQFASYPNEPALSIADWVRQFVLAPPFAWRWNRAAASFSITLGGGSDYTQALASFGWMEKAYLVNGSGLNKELEVRMNLSADSTTNEPAQIAPYLDDDNGNITFRLLPSPDQNYTVNIVYQKSAPQFAALTDTWAPIPDYYSYLYNQGFLAKAYEQMTDDRFGLTLQIFMRQVIAANAGLSDSQVNLFMLERIDTQREVQEKLGNSQIGRIGRGFLQG